MELSRLSSVKERERKNPNVVGVDRKYRHSPPALLLTRGHGARPEPTCAEPPVKFLMRSVRKRNWGGETCRAQKPRLPSSPPTPPSRPSLSPSSLGTYDCSSGRNRSAGPISMPSMLARIYCYVLGLLYTVSRVESGSTPRIPSSIGRISYGCQ